MGRYFLEIFGKIISGNLFLGYAHTLGPQWDDPPPAGSESFYSLAGKTPVSTSNTEHPLPFNTGTTKTHILASGIQTLPTSERVSPESARVGWNS
jgi:hypothetical protein